MKILITSGGTDVPIDDVRRISNMSSGRYGAEISQAFYKKLYDVWYFSSKYSVVPSITQTPDGGSFYHSVFKDYNEYLEAFQNEVSKPYDIIVSAAAVSDYILDKTQGKIPSDDEELVIRLKKAPKVLPLIRKHSPNALLVGFKLLVSPSLKDALRAIYKVFNNGADLVVYNDLTEIRKGNNERLVFTPDMNFEVAKNATELVDIILKHKK
jgi:phosphopantothenoylcysteine decarboxylase/phosphopantothenate--cysteine ligase